MQGENERQWKKVKKKTEITSWLVCASDFYSRTSKPTMKLFVYFISTEISFKQ